MAKSREGVGFSAFSRDICSEAGSDAGVGRSASGRNVIRGRIVFPNVIYVYCLSLDSLALRRKLCPMFENKGVHFPAYASSYCVRVATSCLEGMRMPVICAIAGAWGAEKTRDLEYFDAWPSIGLRGRGCWRLNDPCKVV